MDATFLPEDQVFLEKPPSDIILRPALEGLGYGIRIMITLRYSKSGIFHGRIQQPLTTKICHRLVATLILMIDPLPIVSADSSPELADRDRLRALPSQRRHLY